MIEYEVEYSYKGDTFIIEGITTHSHAKQVKEEVEKEHKVLAKINKIENNK